MRAALKEHLRVFRWRDFQQPRAVALSEIRERRPQLLWDQKVDRVWQSCSVTTQRRKFLRPA